MMLLSTVLGFTAVATAASVPRDTATDEYIWQITKWQAGESHGAPTAPITGWYDFNVSATAYGEGASYIPPFAAHCSGSAAGTPLASEYAACTLVAADETSDASVSARVLPEQSFAQAHIAIVYLFGSDDESSTTRNFTVVIVEDWARERPPHDFTVQPVEA